MWVFIRSEATLRSTHNISFGGEIRKLLCGYSLLSRVLQYLNSPVAKVLAYNSRVYVPRLGMKSRLRKNTPTKFWKKVRIPPVSPSATGYDASQDSSKNNGIVAFMNIPASTQAAYSETIK